MKRIVVALLVASILCGFCSCVENSYYNTPRQTTCAHDWEPATCTEPKTCSKCGETFGDALGHTVVFGTCKRCGNTYTLWGDGEFEDEFDRPIGVKYLIGFSEGEFSNSATNGSELFVAVQVTSTSIGILLWEYGDNIVNTYGSDKYYIKILDGNGEVHRLVGNQYSERIFIDDEENKTEVLDLLKTPQILKFHLSRSGYSLDTYSFDINTSGFNELYDQLYN
mgnify:CR=1 FL=1